MARWKLACSHYLNCVEAVEWEYTETNRSTGKQARKRFRVPRFLNVNDPGDWTRMWGPKDDQSGEIVVCREGKGSDNDIAFEGDPTPDMIPLDDEAKLESAAFEGRWAYKPDTDLPGNYSQSLVDKFEDAMNNVRDQNSKVKMEGMEQMMAMMANIMQQNSQLLQLIAAGGAPVVKAAPAVQEPSPLEQVVDLEPPLDEPEPPTEEELRAVEVLPPPAPSRPARRI